MDDDDNEDSITSDQLFEHPAFQSTPSRVLIEGEAGIGKTTLCQMLAYNWAKVSTATRPEQPPLTSLRRRFDFVFLLDATNASQSATLVDAVYASLLPEGFPVEQRHLADLLATPARQERVLFVLDAYDELVTSHREMALLCRRRLYSRASLLLTSRPTFADDVTRHFGARYVIVGYPLAHRRGFIERYAREAGLPHALLRRLGDILYDNDLLYDLSRNPLYFWFICLLAEDDDRGELPTTRTDLYCAVIELIHRKAAAASGDDCATQLRAVDRFAYDSLADGTSDATEVESAHAQSTRDAWLRYGLVSRERSRSKLHPRFRYTFPHRTMREFFAARYLAEQTTVDRQRLLRHHRGARWHLVVVFLAGLLRADHSALCRLLREAVWRGDLGERSAVGALVAAPPHRQRATHTAHHLGLQCLAECGATFAGFASLRAGLVPRCVSYSVATCHHCLRGLVAAARAPGATRPQLLVSGVDLDVYALRERGGLLDAVAALPHPASLVYHGAESVATAAEHLSRLCERAPLRHLHVHLAASARPITRAVRCSAAQFIPLRRHLRTLAFGGSSARWRRGGELLPAGQQRLLTALSAGIGPRLHRLALAEVTLTGWPADHLLDQLHRCGRLRAIRADAVEIDADVFRRLCEQLADVTNLRELSIKSCQLLPAHANHRLPTAFFRMLRANCLRELVLRGRCIDETNMADFVTALSTDACALRTLDLSYAAFSSRATQLFSDWLKTQSNLQKLTMRKSFVTAEDLKYLIDVIPSLSALQSFDISENRFGMTCLLASFCQSLTSLSGLSDLRMEQCQLADEDVKLISDVIKRLSYVSLLGNSLGTSAAGMVGVVSLLTGTRHLETLHVTAARLRPESAVVVATALARNERLFDLRIACFPNRRLTSKDGLRLVDSNFRRRIPSLRHFRLGFSVDVTSAYESHEWLNPHCAVDS